jgi:DtxR family Mn-dependent transcriptional regulator
LRDVVGVNPEIAEQDACKMEHVLSEETLKKMKALTLTQTKKKRPAQERV